MKYFLSIFLLLGLCGQMLEAINPDVENLIDVEDVEDVEDVKDVQEIEAGPGRVPTCTCVPIFRCQPYYDGFYIFYRTARCENYLEVCCDADSITYDDGYRITEDYFEQEPAQQAINPDVEDVKDVEDVEEVKVVEDVKDVKDVEAVTDVEDVEDVQDVEDVKDVQEIETGPGRVPTCTCVPIFRCQPYYDGFYIVYQNARCENYLEVCCDADRITYDDGYRISEDYFEKEPAQQAINPDVEDMKDVKDDVEEVKVVKDLEDVQDVEEVEYVKDVEDVEDVEDLKDVQESEAVPGTVPTCTCVPYYQCQPYYDDSYIIYQTARCDNYQEICCDADSITDDDGYLIAEDYPEEEPDQQLRQ